MPMQHPRRVLRQPELPPEMLQLQNRHLFPQCEREELVHHRHRSLLGVGVRAYRRPSLRVRRDVRRGTEFLHLGMRLGPGGRQRAGEPRGGGVGGGGGRRLDGGDGEGRDPPEKLQLGGVAAVRVRVGEAEEVGAGGEEAEEVVVGEAERAPQRGELGHLEAAAAGEHEHPREAVGHRRLGRRDGRLLGVDQRRHPLGEPEAGLLPAIAIAAGAAVEEVEAGRVLAEPVGGSAEEVERLEAGLEEADGGGAGREAEEEALDLVVHDPAAVAAERGLQRRVLRGGPPCHAAALRRRRRRREGRGV
ncbi:hypothetical protein EE612_033241, partial [Oryza sativa]